MFQVNMHLWGVANGIVVATETLFLCRPLIIIENEYANIEHVFKIEKEKDLKLTSSFSFIVASS